MHYAPALAQFIYKQFAGLSTLLMHEHKARMKTQIQVSWMEYNN